VNPVRGAIQGVAVLALFVASACSQLLDIEGAHVDPTLQASPGGSAGSATAGNSVVPVSTGESSGGKASGGSLNQDAAEAGASGDAGKTVASSAANGGSAGAPAEADLCERYCDQVTHVCKGKYEQYRTFDQCVQVCKRLPPGEPGDQDTNSVECRLRQAGFADSEPFVYCKSAGPLGAGKCGSNCVSYCSLMQQTCTAESTAGNLEPSYFASSEACLSACSQLPETGQGPVEYSSSATAEPSSFVGNTVFCRTYHVASALEQDAPDEHCPHAMGGDPCIDQ